MSLKHYTFSRTLTKIRGTLPATRCDQEIMMTYRRGCEFAAKTTLLGASRTNVCCLVAESRVCAAYRGSYLATNWVRVEPADGESNHLITARQSHAKGHQLYCSEQHAAFAVNANTVTV